MIVITRKPLDPASITASVENEANGAVVTFLGTTRIQTRGKQVLYLEYEAYEEMAQKMLTRIVEEIRQEWNIEYVSIAHRFGRLEIGEISLVAAVGSPHRGEAFSACQYIVNRIKENVPIWKKEVFEDGEVWVGIEATHNSVTVTPS